MIRCPQCGKDWIDNQKPKCHECGCLYEEPTNTEAKLKELLIKLNKMYFWPSDAECKQLQAGVEAEILSMFRELEAERDHYKNLIEKDVEPLRKRLRKRLDAAKEGK